MTSQRTWRGAVFIAASVGRFIALPDGDLAWLTDHCPEPLHVPAGSGDDIPQCYEDFVAGVSHLVMGRGTYEKVLTFGFRPYEKFRVLVLSTILAEAVDPRITVVRPITEAREPFNTGSATHAYVDELTVTRARVLLGRGPPLFHDVPREVRLIRLGTASSETGTTSTRYAVVREEASRRGGGPTRVTSPSASILVEERHPAPCPWED